MSEKTYPVTLDDLDRLATAIADLDGLTIRQDKTVHIAGLYSIITRAAGDDAVYIFGSEEQELAA